MAQVAPSGSADKRFLSSSPVSHVACNLLRTQSPRLPGSRPTLNIKVFYVTLRLQYLSAARFIPVKPALIAPELSFVKRDPCALRRSFLTGRSCLYSTIEAVSRHHPPFMGTILSPPARPGDHQPGNAEQIITSGFTGSSAPWDSSKRQKARSRLFSRQFRALCVYVQAKSEKIFSFGVTLYLRCLRQTFFHKVECLLPLGQTQ